MADDGSQQSTDARPAAKVHFLVEWDSVAMRFEEVSGLDAEVRPIEYRAGDSRIFSVTRMPGAKKFSDVTMKKGVFRNEGTFWTWLNDIKQNTARRSIVTISLIDEDGAPSMVWTLSNAWPTKVSGTDVASGDNEVAIETIVVTHEGLSVRAA